MPWCPKCLTEYQEGITKCADCGSELVDELPEVTEIDEEEAHLIKALEDAANEAALTEGVSEGITVEGEVDENAVQTVPVFVSKRETNKEMAETAVTFLVFAVLLTVLFVLSALDVIPWFSSIASLIVIAAMAIGCCLVGINAVMRARRAADGIAQEDETKAKIKAWLEANISEQLLEEKFGDVEPAEEKYLRQSRYVTDELYKEFELPVDGLVEYMTDEYLEKFAPECEGEPYDEDMEAYFDEEDAAADKVDSDEGEAEGETAEDAAAENADEAEDAAAKDAEPDNEGEANDEGAADESEPGEGAADEKRD